MKNNTRINLSKILLFIGLLIIWLIPGILFYLKNYTDPFLYFRITKLISLQSSGFIDYTVFKSGYELLLYSLIGIPNIPVGSFIYYPIGSILLPLIYFLIIKSITKSTYIAIASSIYIAYLHSLITVQFNSFIYTWTNILIIIYIYTVYKYIMTRKITFIIVLWILFFANAITYQTTTGWMVASAMFISAASFLTINKKIMVSLSLSFLVFYVTFEEYLYTALFPKVFSNKLRDPFEGVYDVLNIAFGEKSNMAYTSTGLYTVSPIINPVVSASTLITMLLLLLPTLYLFIKIIIHILKENHQKKVYIELIFILSVVFIGLAHFIAYYFYSGFSLSFRPVLLLFPLIIPIIFRLFIDKKKYEFVTTLYYIILLFSVFIGFISFYPNVNHYETVNSQEEVSNFLIKTGLTNPTTVISDLNTYGALSVNLALKGNGIAFQPFDSNSYAYLIGDFNSSIKYYIKNSVFIINQRNYNSPIIGFGWINYSPLNRYIQEKNDNINSVKFYTDGSNEIIRVEK